MTHPAEVANIRLAISADGTLTYLIDHTLSELPAIRGRDLLAAWDAARNAANEARWAGARAFRFRSVDGSWIDLALHDRDARCWAGAVDRAVGMQTAYGLAVCLRLLALVDLLGRAPWTAHLVILGHHGPKLHPSLLKLAAERQLTDEAGFDEAEIRACLERQSGQAGCNWEIVG